MDLHLKDCEETRMKRQTEYIADDRMSTPEYLANIRNMTDEEFQRHIEQLKEQVK